MPTPLPCGRRGCHQAATHVVTATGAGRHTARPTCQRHLHLTTDQAAQTTGATPHLQPLPGAPPGAQQPDDQQLALDL